MELKNYMESLVLDRIDNLIAKDEGICGCPRCRYDIAALALNVLPPRYIVTDQGGAYAKIRSLEQQFNVDIDIAIGNAIKIVKSDPHHSKAE